MEQFIIIGFLIIFVAWLNYEIGKNNRLSKKKTEEFWEKESQANRTRKGDISGLDYISIPFDRLPINDNPDQTINSYRDTILSQSSKKILNLSGISNTELKLKYGAPNLTLLTEYDNNYAIMVAVLHKWGERLYINSYYKEAIAVLEVALDCRTDVYKTFELVAKIYSEKGLFDKINLLEDRISSSSIRNKETLLSKLEELKRSK